MPEGPGENDLPGPLGRTAMCCYQRTASSASTTPAP
ncbi:hypothetical protein A3Q37_01798 [Streptomyces sp. PTY087I2]|nr:hypothetical protein A3Q37_01798 [Streptomyces sp. PTY087I2]